MPEHLIVGGAAAYTDEDGMERIAWQGDVVDLPADEADRLMELGMLYDEEKVAAEAEAAEAARQEARDREDQAIADEKERIEGEKAAAAEAERVAKQPAKQAAPSQAKASSTKA